MIKVNNLFKKYKIYSSGFSRLRDWFSPKSMKFHKEFWALRDVSFELETGGSLGIIGANGAGKSTLLKILSGVLTPSAGNFEIDGRIASLLDLGLGFHPQLSGRENISLSARFLGLTGEEIENRIKEMIEFAELGSFMDFPLKTYSSGMFVRLAFAVAAGVDPDVLVVDEVLSVGDEYFQKKSLNRVEHIKELGRTIVIVSHMMPVIRKLCDKTIWLDEGKVMAFGKTNEVIKEYMSFSNRRENLMFGGEERGKHLIDIPEAQDDSRRYMISPKNRFGSGEIQITKVEMVGKDGQPKWHFLPGERVRIRLFYKTSSPSNNPVFGLLIHSLEGTELFATANYNIDPFDFGRVEGAGCVEYTINQLSLNKGSYFLSAGVYLKPEHPFWDNPADFHYQMYEFRVWSDKIDHGVIHMCGSWRVRED